MFSHNNSSYRYPLVFEEIISKRSKRTKQYQEKLCSELSSNIKASKTPSIQKKFEMISAGFETSTSR